MRKVKYWMRWIGGWFLFWIRGKKVSDCWCPCPEECAECRTEVRNWCLPYFVRILCSCNIFDRCYCGVGYADE